MNLNKYKNSQPRLLLHDGGVVVGEIVDNDNHLHYVVKRSHIMSLERANKTRVIQKLVREEPLQITVKSSQIIDNNKEK